MVLSVTVLCGDGGVVIVLLLVLVLVPVLVLVIVIVIVIVIERDHSAIFGREKCGVLVNDPGNRAKSQKWSHQPRDQSGPPPSSTPGDPEDELLDLSCGRWVHVLNPEANRARPTKSTSGQDTSRITPSHYTI